MRFLSFLCLSLFLLNISNDCYALDNQRINQIANSCAETLHGRINENSNKSPEEYSIEILLPDSMDCYKYALAINPIISNLLNSHEYVFAQPLKVVHDSGIMLSWCHIAESKNSGLFLIFNNNKHTLTIYEAEYDKIGMSHPLRSANPFISNINISNDLLLITEKTDGFIKAEHVKDLSDEISLLSADIQLQKNSDINNLINQLYPVIVIMCVTGGYEISEDWHKIIGSDGMTKDIWTCECSTIDDNNRIKVITFDFYVKSHTLVVSFLYKK